MALSKTWYTTANRALDDVTTAQKMASSALFALYGTLAGYVSGTDGPEGARPSSVYWTLAGSSDSSTAGIDATQRIGTSYNNAKWVNVAAGGTPHTWFVLQSPSGLLDGPWYLCVDWIGASVETATFVISKNAFTGGTTSARPTSTNEAALTGQLFIESVVAACKSYFSTDANGGFRFLLSRNGQGIFQFYLGIESLVEARTSGDSGRTLMFCQQTTSARGAGTQETSMSVRGLAQDGTTALVSTIGTLFETTFSATGGSWGTSSTGTNSIDSQVDALPMGWVYDNTTSHKGIRGRLPDWWAVAAQVAVGSTVPSTGSPERIIAGTIMIPGSVAPSL